MLWASFDWDIILALVLAKLEAVFLQCLASMLCTFSYAFPSLVSAAFLASEFAVACSVALAAIVPITSTVTFTVLFVVGLFIHLCCDAPDKLI